MSKTASEEYNRDTNTEKAVDKRTVDEILVGFTFEVGSHNYSSYHLRDSTGQMHIFTLSANGKSVEGNVSTTEHEKDVNSQGFINCENLGDYVKDDG